MSAALLLHKTFRPAQYLTGWLLLLLLHTAAPAAGQALSWQAVQGLAPATPGPNDSRVLLLAPNGTGNVYVAGVFGGSITLGGITLTTTTTRWSAFVAKWLPASNTYAWAVTTGGGGQTSVYPAALTVSGNNLYLAGVLNAGGGAAQFGSVALSSGDVFITKLVDAGASAGFAWALSGGAAPVSSLVDAPTSLAVSGGSIYLGGSFESATHTFGATVLANAATTTTADAYVAKIADAGTSASFAWAARFGSTAYDEVDALAVSNNALYMSGHLSSAASVFGSVAPAAAGLFVARLTDAGTGPGLAWLTSTSGGSGAIPSALLARGSGLYLTGNVGGTVSFGSTALTQPGASNFSRAFVARLTDTGTAGTFDWATQVGSPAGNTSGSALALSSNGVYVSGGFISPTRAFGAITVSNTTAAANHSDGFVARLVETPAGGGSPAWAWASSAGAAATDENFTALALAGNLVAVGGSARATTTRFNPLSLNNPNASRYLGYLATLTDPFVTAARPALVPALAELYPNPAHGTATLHLPAGAVRQSLSLLGALGREVRRYPAPPAGTLETPLDLHGLPAGLYSLRGAGLGRLRLVVE